MSDYSIFGAALPTTVGQGVKSIEENCFLIGAAKTYDLPVPVPASGRTNSDTAYDCSDHMPVWIAGEVPSNVTLPPRYLNRISIKPWKISLKEILPLILA